MEYDDKLIEDAVLALLVAYSSDKGNAWNGFDFEIMNRLQNIVSSVILFTETNPSGLRSEVQS